MEEVSEFQDITNCDLEFTVNEDSPVMTVEEQKPETAVSSKSTDNDSSESYVEYDVRSTSSHELDDCQLESEEMEEVADELVQSVIQAAADYIIRERNAAEDIAANITAATMTEAKTGLKFLEALNGSPTLESDKNAAEIHAPDYVNDSAPDNSFNEGISSTLSHFVEEEKDEKIDTTDLLLENSEEDKSHNNFTASGVTTTNASVSSNETVEQEKHERPDNEEKLIELENTPLITKESTSDTEVDPDNSAVDQYQIEEEVNKDMVKCTATEDRSSDPRSLPENINYRPGFTQRNLEATKWFGQSTAVDKIWMKPLGKVDANAELERRKLIKAMTRRHNPDLVPKWQPPKEVDWRDTLDARQRESLKKYEERQRQRRERSSDCTSASDTQIAKDDMPSEQHQSSPPATNTHSPFKASERNVVTESVVRSREAINQWETTLYEKHQREHLERKRLSIGKNRSVEDLSAAPPKPLDATSSNVSSTSCSTLLASENIERDSVDISQVRNRWRKMERESKIIPQPTFKIKNGTCTKITSNSFTVAPNTESKRLAEMPIVTINASERADINREISEASAREEEWKYHLSRTPDVSKNTKHHTIVHTTTSPTQRKIENNIRDDASRDEIWKEIHSPEALEENTVLHNRTSPTRNKTTEGTRSIDRSEAVTSTQSYQSPHQSSNQSTSIDKSSTNHQALQAAASDEYAINRKVEEILRELASTDPNQRNLVLLKTLQSLESNLVFENASGANKEKKVNDDAVTFKKTESQLESMLLTPPRNSPADVFSPEPQLDEFPYKLRSSSVTSSVISPRGWEPKNRQMTSVSPSFPQRLTHEMESNSTSDSGGIKSRTKFFEPKPHNDTLRSSSKFHEFNTATPHVNEECDKQANSFYEQQVAEKRKSRDQAETKERAKSVHETIGYESPYVDVTEKELKKTTNQFQTPVSPKRYENQYATKAQQIREEHKPNNCDVPNSHQKSRKPFELSASKSPVTKVMEKEMTEAVEREEQWRKEQIRKLSQEKKVAKEQQKHHATQQHSRGAKFTVRPLVNYDTRPYNDSDR